MIDDTTLDHLGRLARLAIDPAARPRLAADLDRILGLFERLKALPLDAVVPMAHPHEQHVTLRPDAVTDAGGVDALLALAPESQGGYYVVPKVIE
jgi:aspartyl-tRNA(Asn)/glutamyl-tRNA(Gln) amidotransferase subunit C